MPKCKCGARWRFNYPHGRKSKGEMIFIRKHLDKCKYPRGSDNGK